MSRIMECPACGAITETFRPKSAWCNHNQDELDTPRSMTQLVLVDPLFEAYVKSWIEYHLAAEKYDGHIKQPTTTDDLVAVRHAVHAGIAAQMTVLNAQGMHVPTDQNGRKLWNRAKLEALRILGKDQE